MTFTGFSQSAWPGDPYWGFQLKEPFSNISSIIKYLAVPLALGNCTLNVHGGNSSICTQAIVT